MSELDLKHLRKIAEAATPGPWETYDPNEGSGHAPLWCVANEEFHNPSGDEDAEWMGLEVHVGDKTDSDYIAAFDPPTVLALIARVQSAEAKLARVRELHRPVSLFEHADSCTIDDDAHIADHHHEFSNAPGEEYCDLLKDGETCSECAKLSENADELPSYPCATIRALDGAQ